MLYQPSQMTTVIASGKKKTFNPSKTKRRAVNLKYGDRDDPTSSPAFLLLQVKQAIFQRPNDHLPQKTTPWTQLFTFVILLKVVRTFDSTLYLIFFNATRLLHLERP